MTTNDVDLNSIKEFFAQKIKTFGASPEGVDYKSQQAMDIRFEQLLKVADLSTHFSILDFGCGYGALADYLVRQKISCQYYGYDIVEEMLISAKKSFIGKPQIFFTSNLQEIPCCDYVVESGIFNKKIDNTDKQWTEYILRTLDQFNQLSYKGFAFNLLTCYSDKEYMEARQDLYYADPCFFFDYCKRNYSRNVALFHDYELYDFTIIVRKNKS